MFSDLIAAWKQVYATYLDRKINKVMYYYLVFCIIVVGGMYVYLYYSGTVCLAVLFSTWVGSPPPATGKPPITIVQAIGVILIIRFTLLSGIDHVAKRTPDKIDERLIHIEDKVRELHQLAYTGFLESKEEEKKHGKAKPS